MLWELQAKRKTYTTLAAKLSCRGALSQMLKSTCWQTNNNTASRYNSFVLIFTTFTSYSTMLALANYIWQINFNVRNRFHGNLSNSCWEFSVWTDTRTATAIRSAKPPAWQKISKIRRGSIFLGMFITCKRFLSYYRTSIYFAFTVPDNSIPHMAMLALLSHFRDIDGLIGEVETCSKPLLLRPTQEQREKREKIKTGEQRRGMKKERERWRERKNKNIQSETIGLLQRCYINPNWVRF